MPRKVLVRRFQPSRSDQKRAAAGGMTTMATTIAQVRGGKLRALAVTSAKRDAAAPEIPALAETLPGYEVLFWTGLFGPPGLPREIVLKVQREVSGVLRDPQNARQIAADGGVRIGDKSAVVSLPTDAELTGAALQPIHQLDVCRASGRKITLFGVIRTFFVFQTRDQFRNQEIEIAVALTMPVRAQIDRHAVDGDCEVGTMIQIETPQEILVGLAVAAVLGNDQSWCGFENLADAVDRRGIEFPPRCHTLAGAIGGADECARRPTDDFDLWQLLHAFGASVRRDT